MIAFGRFLELSLPAANVLESLGFYRSLGFAECATGDIRRWHYAVVTDGQVCIGLHGAGVEEPTLSFVRPGLAPHVAELAQRGHDIEWQQLGPDDFHEAALRAPDGHLIRMMEARTFSPGEPPATGPLGAMGTEVAIHCRDFSTAAGYYESAGFLPLEPGAALSRRLQAPGLVIALSEGAGPAGCALRFRCRDPDRTAQDLKSRDFLVRSGPGGFELRAPEGTRLLLEG